MGRFILFIIVFLILYYLLSFLMRVIFSPKKRVNQEMEPEELVQDPYCQTYIPQKSALKKRVGGRDYYFCNRECLEKFLEKKKS
jgi:YHS domain-containing protein